MEVAAHRKAGMEELVDCCGTTTMMHGRTTVVDRRCSTMALVIQRDDLQQWPYLARSSEKRDSVHGLGRWRAQHHTRTHHAMAWAIFFRFSLGSLQVMSGAVSRRHGSRVGIMFSQLFLNFVRVLITGGGLVELCLRQVFRDPVGLGFWWIRLDSVGVRGIWSFYRPL